MNKDDFIEECKNIKKHDYRKFSSYSLLAKNFLKDKINVNVYHDSFDLVRQEICNITEDDSFPNTEHNFYEYFCKNYLNINQLPARVFIEDYEAAIEDLNICNENITSCKNELDRLEKIKKEKRYLDGKENYQQNRMKFYIDVYSQKKEALITFLTQKIMFGAHYAERDGELIYKYNKVKKLTKGDIDTVNEVTNKFLNLGIPNLDEMIDIYYNDFERFKDIILEYCKTEKIENKIRCHVDANHILNKKKHLFEKILKVYENKDYFVFSNLVPLFIEGLFEDMCIELKAEKKDLYAQSLNFKLTYIRNHIYAFLEYEYFAFSFPILRNKIAHGDLNTNETIYLSNMLILDLLSVTRFFVETPWLPYIENREKIRMFSKEKIENFYKDYIKDPTILDIEIDTMYEEHKLLEELKTSIKSTAFLDFLEDSNNLEINNINKILGRFKKDDFECNRVSKLLKKYQKSLR